ncbi:MAG: phosphogluconate dehydrogenase (NADP(+)-dependent, decarboxylating) [Rhodobacterales bacterium]|nr:MAG: phosphogluconate dehydrogenase (NADP(+)-dependent, decarboxylating) [Rhodobacterales bacterium]
MSNAQIGVYGLGTMGSALALNMAENGYQVAVANRETDWIADFLSRAGTLAQNLHGYEQLEDFVQALTPPRVILFMIPSGKPMDAMIAAISPLLKPGDTVIDGGNANFHDTRRRSAAMAKQDLHFVGMGVSGGETGARHGPSLMVGGSDHSWAQLKPVLQAIAADYQGDACVDHLGPDGAGHFVKTVHNGIEYADMQALAEIYALLRDLGGWTAVQIGDLLAQWNTGPLNSYLVEISAEVLRTQDQATGQPLVDVILDQAEQKGTGRWSAIEALNLGQSASMIEAAVGARSWSSEKPLRVAAAPLLEAGNQAADLPGADDLAGALMAARILGHAQGFRILQSASEAYDWGLDMRRIAQIWRAGCIIRSDLLSDLAEAFSAPLPHGQLLLAPAMIQRLNANIPALRRVVCAGLAAGVAIPALAAALSWYDSIRTAQGSSNLLQAQRDFFGAHGFERIDQPGKFHGDWSKSGA